MEKLYTTTDSLLDTATLLDVGLPFIDSLMNDKDDEKNDSDTQTPSPPDTTVKSPEAKPASKPARKTGKRTVFSKVQLSGLENRFRLQSFLSREERVELSSELGLTERQVIIWFQNRRGRLKKRGAADKAYSAGKLNDLQRPYPILYGMMATAGHANQNNMWSMYPDQVRKIAADVLKQPGLQEGERMAVPQLGDKVQVQQSTNMMTGQQPVPRMAGPQPANQKASYAPPNVVVGGGGSVPTMTPRYHPYKPYQEDHHQYQQQTTASTSSPWLQAPAHWSNPLPPLTIPSTDYPALSSCVVPHETNRGPDGLPQTLLTVPSEANQCQWNSVSPTNPSPHVAQPAFTPPQSSCAGETYRLPYHNVYHSQGQHGMGSMYMYSGHRDVAFQTSNNHYQYAPTF